MSRANPNENEDLKIARVVGRRVREERELREWTQAHLADLAGVARPHLVRLEAGQHCPSVAVVYRLARALGIPAASLVAQVEPPTASTKHGKVNAIMYRNWTGHPFCLFLTNGVVLDVPQEPRRIYESTDGSLLTLDDVSIPVARPYQPSDLPRPRPGVVNVVRPEVLRQLRGTRNDLWDGKATSTS